MQRRLFEVRSKLRSVEEEMERHKKEGERKEREWKMHQVKWKREKKAMEERLSKLEERIGGEGRKKEEDVIFGEWSEWEEVEMDTEESEEENKATRGRKRMRSEVSRVSEGSRGGSKSTERGRQERRKAHMSRERRTERGGDIIERHRNKMIMIRKGRNWEEDFGVAEWLQAELGEDLDIQVTNTNDKQTYKIWCEGKGTREKKWEERGRGGRRRGSHPWRHGDQWQKGERE